MMLPPHATVVLDANVLYPAPLRDFLLHLADLKLFKPKWTDIIQREWVRNLLKNRPDLTREKLAMTVRAMNLAFPDAAIKGYESVIDILTLPDIDDRHVLAAALKTGANGIITFNLKDFPDEYVNKLGVTAQHPDSFVYDLISMNKETSFQALENQAALLKNPPMTIDEVLQNLDKCGLARSTKALAHFKR